MVYYSFFFYRYEKVQKMSTVFVQIGQCGNQLSIPLWQNLKETKEDRNTTQVYSTLDGFNRSVHIDSEPKVVKKLPELFKLRDNNIVVGKRGRGTNFALGYNGVKSIGDDHVLENSLEAIRKEVEKCDTYSGCIVLHSLSGGTGSGLGSHIIENLRDLYPCNYIMSCCVAPCVSGESPLQSFNALLTLNWLQNYCDSIILQQNDHLVYQASRKKQSSKSPSVSFQDINKLVASILAGIFLPTDTLSTSVGVSLGQEPWEVVRTLTPMPGLKFVHTAQYSSSKLSWDGMATKLMLQCPKYNDRGEQIKSLAATVIARGDVRDSFMLDMRNGLSNKLKKGFNFVPWNPYPLDCWTSKSGLAGIQGASLTAALNSSSIKEFLQIVLTRSRAKLKAGAYTHWYHRYGITEVSACLLKVYNLFCVSS